MIIWISNNHYDLLMPKNLSERKYREEVNITVNINNNNKSYNIFNKNQDNIKNNDTQDINIEDNNLKKNINVNMN